MMELIKNEESVLNMQKATLIQVGIEGAKKDLIEVDEGAVDASELLVTARKAVEILTAYIAEVKDAVHDELYKKGSTVALQVYGATIELGSTGDRLNYDIDHEYQIRKKALKDREELLKLAFKSDDQIIDGDGGVVEIVPIKTASKEILKIKL